MKPIALLPLLAAFAGSALAAPETYMIEGSHTLPRFSYSHFGFSTQSSRFDKTSGKIVIDRQAKTGSVEVTVDTTSVDTGVPLFNEHIQGPDFLDTAKYPTAKFSSDKLKFEGDKLVAVDGVLTLKGISKPLTLKVESFQCMPHPVLKKDACGANASTVISRTEFNMGKYAPYVSDDMNVTIPVEAVLE
ncbi:MAG: YceI family protein [Methylococcales bacterium]|nr:YceI family protein [Methylococcales bacterium]